jgi:hypothetical protein
VAEYGNETPKYTLRTPALGDYISPNEEQRTAQVIENQLYGAIRVHSGGHGIMRSGNWQVITGDDYSAILTEVKANGKPTIEGFINQIYFFTEEALTWEGLINDNTYFLYVQLVENSTYSTRLNKKVVTGANTTGLIPNDALLVSVLYLNEPSNSIVEKNPLGRLNIYSLGYHIADHQDPHGPFLNQSFLTCSGIDILGYLNYASLQVDQEIVSGNSTLSGELRVLGNLYASGTLNVLGRITYNSLVVQNLTVPSQLTIGTAQVASGLDVYGTTLFRKNVTLNSGVRIDGFDPSVGISLIDGSNVDHLHTHVIGSMGINLKGVFLSPEYSNTVTSGEALTTISGIFQSARIYNDNYYGWYGRTDGTAAILTTKLRLPQDFQRLDRLTVRTGIGLVESGNNVSVYLYDKDLNLVPPVSSIQFATSGLVDSTVFFSGGSLVGGQPVTLVSRMCGASGVATLLGDITLWYVPNNGERIMFSWDQAGAITAPTATFDALRTTPYELRVDTVMASQVVGLSGVSIFSLNITSGNNVIPENILSGTEKPNLNFIDTGKSFLTVSNIVLNRTIPSGSLISVAIDQIASGSQDVSFQMLAYRV